MEITLYGGAPLPQWPSVPQGPQPQTTPDSAPLIPPQQPGRASASLLTSFDKKRVRVAVRVDASGIVHVRLEGPLGLAAEVSGQGAVTIETEI